jgi:hypothetical protein
MARRFQTVEVRSVSGAEPDANAMTPKSEDVEIDVQ